MSGDGAKPSLFPNYRSTVQAADEPNSLRCWPGLMGASPRNGGCLATFRRSVRSRPLLCLKNSS